MRVNVIAPSLTDTPLAKRLLSNDKKKEMMDARHPLKRVGTSQDIANVASFLRSDDSTWITGHVLGVDGGMSTLNVN
jgi:NAD(P)-dependent dehydrogenase (short-subunit alcohol dehydrogenase family)